MLINEMDNFTDEEEEELNPPPDFVRNTSETPTAQADQLAELVRVITDSMQSKVTKEQCVRNIMKCLQVPEELVSIPEVAEAQKEEEPAEVKF